MAFDSQTRNRLARFVADARELIAEEFTQKFQSLYGLSSSGEITAPVDLKHLDDAQHATAERLRARLRHLDPEARDPDRVKPDTIEHLVREQAFTVLNRLAAVRMAEKRGIIVESVGRGYESKGFKVYLQVAGNALGDTYHKYRRYLLCLFDELAVDLGALFDRRSPAGLLFLREPALLRLLQLLNAPDLEPLWAEDETIGWIYQYYNDPAERKKMRDQSSAPRNSRELAVRNQFFTPRYVVEFLTDNTLGRIWFEMTKGQTRLKEQCRYLVRRPNEIFLRDGETAPEPASSADENLSQEELLKQHVHVPHRQLKDPRSIRMLDPACGSMHFGLYSFDLFEVIYDEAWEIAHRSDDTLNSSAAFAPFIAFVAQYPSKTAFLREVPRLIIEHNIHGIDIDPRCAQIAGLSLWLRAQRTWQQQRLPLTDRPRIRRSNIVCAEPMPGEESFLNEFIEAQLSSTPEKHLLGQLVRRVFDAMKLAGEAGSLLKIEDGIAGAVAEAKQKWLAGPKLEQGWFFAGDFAPLAQKELGLDVTGITDDTFWERAEERIYASLRVYAERAENGSRYQRYLFANDAVQGFAFIDLCRKHYDVVLMNPPFGDASLPSKPYLDDTYGDTKGDVYKAFVECFQGRLVSAGYLGIISSRTGFFLGQSEDWRARVVLRLFRPIVLADLGSGVLDAMVEVAAYVLRSLSEAEVRELTLSLIPALEKVARDKKDRFSLPKWQAARDDLKRHQAEAELEHLEAAGFVRRCPGDILRYTPLFHAVKRAGTLPEPVFPPLVCIRALEETEKERILFDAVNGRSESRQFVCDTGNFTALPGAPFSYWVSNAVRRLFLDLPRFASAGREAWMGLSSGCDEQWLRLCWEVPASGQARIRKDTNKRGWVVLSKGGEFATFYPQLHLLVDWAFDGGRLSAWKAAELAMGRITANNSKCWNQTKYFRKGLTWSRRSQKGLSVRILPSGTIFGDKGPGAFAAGDDEKELGAFAAVFNSAPFRGLVALQMAFGSYEVGVIQRTPVPNWSEEEKAHLGRLSHDAWITKRELDAAVQTSHAFLQPALLAVPGRTLAERAAAWAARVRTSEETVASNQTEIDDLVFRLYRLDTADRTALTATLAIDASADAADDAAASGDDVSGDADVHALVSDLLAYLLGVAFGRWDVRLATGQRPASPEPAPFDPLPVCPPGILQGADGTPLSPELGRQLHAAGQYPLDVAWDGILVDDPGHPLDVEARIHKVLQAIWKDHWESIEREACEILGVRTLRDYFRKAACFFADHLKRYSKSRRQAPIYWPLSTASGTYTLWVYYHRLTDQTLHTALADFVEPKIKSVERDAQRQKEEGRTQNYGDSLEFKDELKDLRAEIERIIKLPFKPNMNDGVLVTASPLWKLFRHGKWQKDLKACWEKLEAGAYDWAHLAYTIWPDRVKEKCKTDRSLAIAHGLEALCTVHPAKPRKEKTPNQQPTEDEGEEFLQTEAVPAAAPKPTKDRRTGEWKDFETRRTPIDQTDRTDVLCAIRQLFNDGQARDRDTAIHDVAAALRYQRAGSRIREILHADLLTAVRCGILQNQDGQLSLLARDLRDYQRDFLKEKFLGAIGRAWIEREEAIRAFARSLGFSRIGAVIEETGYSLINGLLRDRRLEADKDQIRRAAG